MTTASDYDIVVLLLSGVVHIMNAQHCYIIIVQQR